MVDSTREPSTFALVRGVVDDVVGLFRKEIDLAKAEASEKVDRVLGAATMLVVAAVLMIGAVGVLLSALVALLAAFLVAQGMGPEAAHAVSALAIGLVLGIVAWFMLSRAMLGLKLRNMALPKTASALGRDAELVKEKI
jgi:uncharacterized membrane protein YqjE